MAQGLVIMPNEVAGSLLSELLPDVAVSASYQPGNWNFIIRFGDATGSDDNALVLNRASILATPDLISEAQSHWRASSIRFLAPGRRITFYKRYRVQVFDLEPIYMQKIEIGRRRTIIV
ncbi:MAG: hypothetical protein GX033_07880, partial [Firmicutes bacterium]|nr:hypothetical protein [Bacillota bacterium]